MKNLYDEGNTRTPQQVAVTEDEYPFLKHGNVTHRKYTRTFHQHRASYAPMLPGTEDSRRAGFYVVEQTVPERIAPRLVKFQVTYSNIPAQVSAAGSTQFTRPDIVAMGLIGASATLPVNYGNEESGNAGLIRPLAGSKTYDFFTRRAVSTDTGVTSDPTGGTFTATIGTIGTTAPIAYNASASTILAALNAASPTTQNLVAAVTNGTADFSVNIAAHQPQLIAVSGTGMEKTQILPHALAYATKPGTPVRVSFIDSGLTYVAPTIAGADSFRVVLEPQVGDSIVPPLYTYRIAVGSQYVWSYKFGTLTGGTVRGVIGGVETADITFTPSALGQFAAAVNAALATTSGVTFDFVASVKYHENYIEGYKFTANTYGSITKPSYLIALNGAVDVVVGDGGYGPAPTERRVQLPRPNAPASFSYKLSYAYLGGAYASDEVTLDQDDDKAAIEAAIATLDYVIDHGLPSTLASFERFAGGVAFTIPLYYFPMSYASSLTPTPSEVVVSGERRNLITLRANIIDRFITTAQPHGLGSQRRIFVKRGSNYVFIDADYEVVSEHQIRVKNTELPWRDPTAITELGSYITRYQAGTFGYNSNDVTNYWLPGITPGISSAADIPQSVASLTDAQFVDAHFTTSSPFVAVENGQLEYYLGPILSQTTKYIKIR